MLFRGLPISAQGKDKLATDPHRPTWNIIVRLVVMKRHIFSFREATASFVRPGRPNKVSVYVCVCLWPLNYYVFF